MKADVYEKITAKIVADLEKGVRPWQKPWIGGAPRRPLRHNGIPYQGINVIMLWMESTARGFSSPFWMTYRQAGEYGGQVRKGERGTLVVFAKPIKKTEINAATGESVERTIPVWKGFTVFNAEQVDNLPERFTVQTESLPEPAERDAAAEAFFAAIGADVRHGGAQAFYSPSTDHVQMPEFTAFCDAPAYYGTLAHEHVHWTKTESRLNRDFGRKRWGDEGYAMEELVAELGAAFLCADIGLAPEPRDDHSSYIDSWLRVLKGDKRAIFSAASYAQRAADYLTRAAGAGEEESEEESEPEERAAA